MRRDVDTRKQAMTESLIVPAIGLWELISTVAKWAVLALWGAFAFLWRGQQELKKEMDAHIRDATEKYALSDDFKRLEQKIDDRTESMHADIKQILIMCNTNRNCSK